jgi:hypothetical protein
VLVVTAEGMTELEAETREQAVGVEAGEDYTERLGQNTRIRNLTGNMFALGGYLGRAFTYVSGGRHTHIAQLQTT